MKELFLEKKYLQNCKGSIGGVLRILLNTLLLCEFLTNHAWAKSPVLYNKWKMSQYTHNDVDMFSYFFCLPAPSPLKVFTLKINKLQIISFLKRPVWYRVDDMYCGRDEEERRNPQHHPPTLNFLIFLLHDQCRWRKRRLFPSFVRYAHTKNNASNF